MRVGYRSYCRFEVIILLNKLFNSPKKQELISYILFGLLTTAVNWCVYFPFHYTLSLSAAVSNAIAWTVSVLFAYITNKLFVFKSYNWSFKTVSTEIVKFFGGRLFTGLLETLLLRTMVDHFGFNGLAWKLIASVIVVITNYIFSKIFVFYKRTGNETPH